MVEARAYCTGCGRGYEPARGTCPACGAPRELTRRQRASGLAFLLNEMQAPPLASVMTAAQHRELETHYADQLQGLSGRRAPAYPARAPAGQSTGVSPKARLVREAARPERPSPPPRPLRPPREPYDWSWLAEQQANLFLFAGAFLTVVAALIYVGYSGQNVGGALKMTLLSLYTLAFLAAGVACLRFPGVRMAGQVFFGVGAVLVPLNFLAARSVLEDRNLDPTTMWLSASAVTAAFYATVAYCGLGRWYAWGAAAAAVSASVAACVVAGVAPEWMPVCFMAAGAAMAWPTRYLTPQLRDCVGDAWSPTADLFALAAGGMAVGHAILAAAGISGGEVTTRWFLPAAFAAAAVYGAVPALRDRRHACGVGSIAGLAGAGASVVYATHAPAEYYTIAFAALAPLFGALMVRATGGRAASRLPARFDLTLRYAAIAATLASAIVALLVLQATGSRDPYALATRWYLAPAFALALSFYVIDAFVRGERSGVTCGAIAVAGLFSGVVYGLNVSEEYYAFAFIAAGAAGLAWARQAGGLTSRIRVPAGARADAAWLAYGATAAGIGIASVAAIAAAEPGSTYAPQSSWFLAAAFAAAAATVALHLTMRERPLGEGDRVAMYAFGAALAGAAAGVVYALEVSAEHYAFAFAAAAFAIVGVTAVVLPRISGERPWRREDGVAATHMAVAGAMAVAIGAALAGAGVAHDDPTRVAYEPQSRWFLPALFALTASLYVAAAAVRPRTWRPAPAMALAGIVASIFGISTGVVYALGVQPEYYAFAFLAPAIALGVAARATPDAALARMLPYDWRELMTLAARLAVAAGVAVALGAVIAGAAPDGTYRPESRAFLPAAFASAAAFLALDASRARRRTTSAAFAATVTGAIVSLPYTAHAGAAWYGVAFACAGLLYGAAGRTWMPAWLDRRVLDAAAVAAISVSWLPFEGAYREAARTGVAVHFAAASFYLAAALTGRSKITLGTLLDVPAAAAPVRLVTGWLYAAGQSAAIGYVYALRAVPAAADARASTLALPLMGLAIGFAACGASSRWWRREFRMHFYAMSLAVAAASLLIAPSGAVLASLLAAYVCAYALAAVWEDTPELLAPSVVCAFLTVVAWRQVLGVSPAAIPLSYSVAGSVLVGAAALVRAGRARWAAMLAISGAAFAAAAPAAGFGMLAAGLAPSTHFEESALYTASTISLAIAAGLGLVVAAVTGRRAAIVPATALLVVALLLEIGRYRPGNVQAYTAIIGAYLVLLALVGLWRLRLIPAASTAAPYVEALGAAVIMFPSFAQSLDGAWSYQVLLLVEAASFFSCGIALRRRGMLAAGMTFLVLVAGRALFDAVHVLPNWIVVMTAGVALLGIGMGILLGRERWRSWQEGMLRWWGETGDAPGLAR